MGQDCCWALGGAEHGAMQPEQPHNLKEQWSENQRWDASRAGKLISSAHKVLTGKSKLHAATESQ